MPWSSLARVAPVALAVAFLGCGAPDSVSPSVVATGGTQEAETPGPGFYSVAVIGDMPYGQAKADSLPGFINFLNADRSVFMTIHVGDIKAGSKSPCSDSLFVANFQKFQQLRMPLIYTPGDNEWTDCHQPIKNNGVFTPTERLAAIRKLFFPVPGQSLGQRTRSTVTQAWSSGEDRTYVENVWTMELGVMFGTVNITGSNDDIAPWGSPLAPDSARWPSQARERATRLPANLRWIREVFRQAQLRGARAVALAFQADMWDPAEPTLVGFDDYVALIGQLAQQFGKPVLLLDGDSHVFKVDNPYSATSPLHGMHPNTPVVNNITRIVTSGSGNVTSYVRLVIDPKSPSVFSWQEIQYK